jgi:3',5'-cyclic AMP phosphodiesterase CpdA
MKSKYLARVSIVAGAMLIAAGMITRAQRAQARPPAAAPADTVRAINAPAHPLPDESASAGITKFSFIAYGDTRGRRDGVELQYEHGMIVDSMLATIRRLKATEYPVRFVVQSGDAVVNGRVVNQWNTSFIDLINRLTGEGDVPYFFAAGNHDVTSTMDLANAGRKTGLENLFDANRNLLPADGSPRRLAGYPTYAFGFGNTFVLALDSNIPNDDTQFAWVKAQLDGLDRARYHHVIAFFHHPPFSSGPHGSGTPEAATLGMRTRYDPLFRQYHVRMTIGGHEHLFEHWIERYTDSTGQKFRMDQLVTGGGGAPLYAYQGEPNIADYLKANAAEKVTLEHFVKPGPKPGDNPYHYVVVQVDGDTIDLDVVGVDWGRDFKPYTSAHLRLSDGGGR